MGCGNEVSDWDREAVKDSIAGKNTRPDPKILEETRPAVEAAIEKRCIECFKENIESSMRAMEERMKGAGRLFTPLEKFDLERIPTDREYHDNLRIAKELGFKDYTFINNPVVIAVKDEKSGARLEKSEECIKEALIALKDSKLPAKFKDCEVADRIVFFDEKVISERGTTIKGHAVSANALKGDIRLDRTVHVFQNDDGELQRGKEAQWTIVHELCHLNLHKRESDGGPGDFEKIFISNMEEWVAACEKQMNGPGTVSPYAAKKFHSVGPDWPKEFGYLHPDFIAESVSLWDVGLVEICPELDKFFNDHLREK